MSANPAVRAAIAEHSGPTSGARHKLFVYGTLKRGYERDHLLKDCIFAGQSWVKGLVMINLTKYPAAVELPGHAIFGEMYYVDHRKLQELDVIEGTSRGLYARLAMKNMGGDEVQVYVNKTHDLTAECKWIPNGIWQKNAESYRWFGTEAQQRMMVDSDGKPKLSPSYRLMGYSGDRGYIGGVKPDDEIDDGQMIGKMYPAKPEHRPGYGLSVKVSAPTVSPIPYVAPPPPPPYNPPQVGPGIEEAL